LSTLETTKPTDGLVVVGGSTTREVENEKKG